MDRSLSELPLFNTLDALVWRAVSGRVRAPVNSEHVTGNESASGDGFWMSAIIQIRLLLDPTLKAGVDAGRLPRRAA